MKGNRSIRDQESRAVTSASALKAWELRREREALRAKDNAKPTNQTKQD